MFATSLLIVLTSAAAEYAGKYSDPTRTESQNILDDAPPAPVYVPFIVIVAPTIAVILQGVALHPEDDRIIPTCSPVVDDASVMSALAFVNVPVIVR
jgi:hypothetical protein